MIFFIPIHYQIIGKHFKIWLFLGAESFNIKDFQVVDFDNHTEIKQSKSYFNAHQERVEINKNKCKGCRICSRICPTGAITMKCDKNNELYATIDYKKCIYCNKCVTACPYSMVDIKTPLSYKLLEKEIEKENKKQT